MSVPDLMIKRCGQQLKGGVACNEMAGHRYTWPGRDEALICDKCAPQLRGVAAALGMHLQTIPLGER